MPFSASYSIFTPIKRFKKAYKGRKAKIRTNLRLFQKNTREGILKLFSRPPRERNERPVFSFPRPRLLPMPCHSKNARRPASGRGQAAALSFFSWLRLFWAARLREKGKNEAAPSLRPGHKSLLPLLRLLPSSR